MRHTRSHTKNRRSHHALKAPTLARCQNCGEPHRPHHMCLACGFYKGRMVIDMAKKREERETRIQKKRDMIRAEQQEAGAALEQPEQTAESATQSAEDSTATEENKR
ncbi:MAG: 50S ribosomal protein L32 [Patescibacteria group bacterium]